MILDILRFIASLVWIGFFVIRINAKTDKVKSLSAEISDIALGAEIAYLLIKIIYEL